MLCNLRFCRRQQPHKGKVFSYLDGSKVHANLQVLWFCTYFLVTA